MPFAAWLSASALLACALSALAGQEQPAARAALSPDERLWQEIAALRRDPPADRDMPEQFDDLIAQRLRLADRLRLYQSLFPGGAHAVVAAELEFEALFEAGALQGGDLQMLAARVAEAETSDQESLRAEAAYWRMLTQRAARVDAPAASRPAVRDVTLLEAYRDFVTVHPASRHVPRLAAILFDHALATQDLAQMQALDTLVREHFGHTVLSQQLSGKLRRAAALGQPFHLPVAAEVAEAPAPGNGRPTLLVVWSLRDVAAGALLEQAARLAQQHPELVLSGICLDAFEQAAAPGWPGAPLVCDPRGLGGAFALHWGLTTTPWVFVVDRGGLLVGAYDDERWRSAVEQVVSKR